MSADVIAAFATLLTPLGAMGAAVFALLVRRIKRLEGENANLVGYVIANCSGEDGKLEALADLIVKNRGEG